jgi:hypothetical protein
VKVSYGGFTPFEYVQLIVASTPRVIGSGYANSKGVVTLEGDLPAGLASGFAHSRSVRAGERDRLQAGDRGVRRESPDDGDEFARWHRSRGARAPHAGQRTPHGLPQAHRSATAVAVPTARARGTLPQRRRSNGGGNGS